MVWGTKSRATTTPHGDCRLKDPGGGAGKHYHEQAKEEMEAGRSLNARSGCPKLR